MPPAKLPRYYWDLAMAKKEAARGQTPWTPGITVLYGFREALRLMRAEGLEAVYAKHRRIGAYTRAALKNLGLRLVPVDERRASDTVTAFYLPQGVDEKAFLEQLRTQFGVVLAGGQGDLAGKSARIGHMGMVEEADIDDVTRAIRQDPRRSRRGGVMTAPASNPSAVVGTPRILVTDPIAPDGVAYLRQHGSVRVRTGLEAGPA